ncbi:MAG: hypothetical protein HON70_08950, partial [Lentisphaerae bacterium]|nr:hypothetical protein [Lentisphaerota bacterium]
MFRSCRVRHLFGLLPLLSFSLLAGTDIPLSGLLSHFAFDGDLLGRAPGGEESRGSFSRHSMATGGAFERIHANAPCFLPGRNGRGLLLSPGFETAKKVTFRNYLAPVAAEILPGGDSGRGWEPVGEGKLTVRPSGDAPHLSLQGRYWLEMVAPRPGDGMVFSPAVDLLEGQYVFSFHVRTAPSRAAAELSVVVGSESGEELARCAVVPGEEWTRHEAVFTLGRFTRDKSKQEYHRISIRLAAAAPAQQLAFDAFQLEFLGGYSYAGIRSASDWMPGHAYRAADRLSFPGLNSGLTHRRGSVAFWFSPHIRKQHRRTLFEIPRSNRWEPHLQLAFVDDASFALSSRRDGRTLEKRVPRREELQTWCHVVVTWDVDHAVLYLDGREAARLKGVEIPTPLPAFRLGSAGPNASAGAVFDDLIVYDRPVTAGEAAALADLEACLERGIQPDVCIRPGRFLPTIARTPGRQRWECTITNTGADRVRRLLATLTIGPSVLDRVEVGKLGVGESRLIAFRFVPDLVTGVYSFAAVVEAAGHEVAAFRRVVRITRAAVPYENLQVSPWGWNAPRELGFTIGGGRVEDAMVDGLAWGPLKHYVGYPRRVLGEDWVQGMTGSPFRTNFHDSKHMRAQLTREAEAFAEEFRHVPAARSVTLTSEMQWIWQHDYSQPRRDWVKKVFGLDLTAWQDPPKGNVDAFQNPYGRLKPSVAKMNPPADRVLELSDPLYAYHRWFHGTTGPTESLMNQTISDAIHVGRPDVLTVQEPILRRCAVRAFERVSIAQEWYYYENPMAAVMVQERLNAAVRGTRMRPTGMPQFLFKKGRAAPYAAMPTADM